MPSRVAAASVIAKSLAHCYAAGGGAPLLPPVLADVGQRESLYIGVEGVGVEPTVGSDANAPWARAILEKAGQVGRGEFLPPFTIPRSDVDAIQGQRPLFASPD